MKVLSLVQGLSAPGGIESFIAKTTLPLHQAGVETIVLSASGGEMVSPLEEAGAEVVLPESNLEDIRWREQKVWLNFVQNCIDKIKPDLLYPYQIDRLYTLNTTRLT